MKLFLSTLWPKVLAIQLSPAQEERILFCLRIISAAMILIAFAAKSWVFIDPDLGWHIKTAQDFGSRFTVPFSDPYSYTMPSYLWVDHEWLGHVVLAKLLEFFTIESISILAGILFAIPFGYWILGARSFLHLFVINCFALMMLGIVGLRPQIYSFLIFFVVVELLDTALRRESRFLLYGLVPLFFLWANSHGSFVGGLAFISLYWLGRIILQRKVDRFDWVFLAIIIASYFSTLANPYSYYLWLDTYYGVSTPFLKYIGEWQSGLLYASFTGGMLFGALFGIGRAMWKEIPRAQLLPIGFLFVNYLQHVRIITFFYTSLQPLLRKVARDAEMRFLSMVNPRLRTLVVIVMALMTFAPTAYLSFVGNISSPYRPPIDEIRAYVTNIAPRISGNLFNDYGIGGTLIGAMDVPRVFIDGRMPHWVLPGGYSAMKDFTAVFYEHDDGWKEVFSRNNIQVVFINPRGDDTARELKNVGIAWFDDMRKIIQNWLLSSDAKNIEQMLLDEKWCTIFKTPNTVIMVAPGQILCKAIK